MCSCCYNDPAEDKRHLQRQGAVEVEDFYKEVNYAVKEKKKPKRTRPGCPENDNGPHVYIWTTEVMVLDYIFYQFYGFHEYEQKVCCGCKKKYGKSRHTARYIEEKERRYRKAYPGIIERGEPVSRRRWRDGKFYAPMFKWWSWENEDEEYRAFKKKYLTQHGYTKAFYGPSIWD